MAEDLFLEFNRGGLLPFRFDTIGSWWDKGEQIDLVAYQKESSFILFCECKWQDPGQFRKTSRPAQKESGRCAMDEQNQEKVLLYHRTIVFTSPEKTGKRRKYPVSRCRRPRIMAPEMS